MDYSSLVKVMRVLHLTPAQLSEMVHHATVSQPMEACGLLAGNDQRVEKVIQVRNRVQSPVRFVMDPIEQLRAFEWIEDNDLELLGIYHSHPAGPAEASPTDIAQAAYAVVYVILSLTERVWQARGFWIEGGKAGTVNLQIDDTRNHHPSAVFND